VKYQDEKRVGSLAARFSNLSKNHNISIEEAYPAVTAAVSKVNY
jgi:hypothetical protein